MKEPEICKFHSLLAHLALFIFIIDTAILKIALILLIFYSMFFSCQGVITLKNKFSLFTVYSTILALIIGNLVVATNSGDACGTDWPRCNGTFFPNITNIRILIEYSHRIFTTVLGFIILINAVLAWIVLRKKKTKWFSVVSFFLLGLQSIIGGLNVLLGTPVGFTTFDVIVSLLLLISVIYLHYALVNRDIQKETVNRRSQFTNPAFLLLFFIMTETVIGAVFKHPRFSKLLYDHYNGEVLINSPMLAQFIYFVHGIIGLAIVISTLYLLFSSFQANRDKLKMLILIITLVITTIFGFLTKIYELSPFTSSFHMIFTIISIALSASISAINRVQG